MRKRSSSLYKMLRQLRSAVGGRTDSSLNWYSVNRSWSQMLGRFLMSWIVLSRHNKYMNFLYVRATRSRGTSAETHPGATTLEYRHSKSNCFDQAYWAGLCLRSSSCSDARPDDQRNCGFQLEEHSSNHTIFTTRQLENNARRKKVASCLELQRIGRDTPVVQGWFIVLVMRKKEKIIVPGK